MNTASLNNLWSYLQGLSLTASNQRWLANHLIEAAEKTENKEIEGHWKEKTYRDTLAYQQAMEYMDSFVAEDLTEPVPAEEKGIDALIEHKYLL